MGSTVGMTYDSTKRVATGANLDIRSLASGLAKRIRVTNLANMHVAEYNEALNDGEALVRTNTGTLTLVTTTGFTPLAGSSTQPPGFRLGILPNINDTTTENLLIEAWG